MVDIIVPFYNAAATLEQTLASVEAQTYTDWRVIFIDDGSTDSSALIAQTFIQKNNGKGKIIQSLKARSGPAVGRNHALQNAVKTAKQYLKEIPKSVIIFLSIADHD